MSLSIKHGLINGISILIAGIVTQSILARLIIANFLLGKMRNYKKLKIM